MNQTTNKNNKKNLRPVPQAEMRQNVLKSGLCNELIAGVLTDNGEIPDISGRTAGGVQNVAATQSMEATPPMASGESQPQIQQEVRPSDEEIKLYIQSLRENCKAGEMTIESLVVKICDLAERNNQLVNLIGKIQSGEAVYISGEDPAAQIADGQMPQGGGMQNPQMQFVGENPLPQAPPQQNAAVSSEMTYAPITANGYTFTGGSRGAAPQNIPRSTGGTGGHAQRQMFIPKSQVEKMTREEIRQMFDVIDKSRKEW